MEILSRSWNSREIGEHGRDVPPRIRGIMIRVQKIRKTNKETRIALIELSKVTLLMSRAPYRNISFLT